MAATASAGALPAMMMRAMVNRDVDVRFSDRERLKVNFRSGTRCVPPATRSHAGPVRPADWLLAGRASSVLAASQVHGDRPVTLSNAPRTRGASLLYDARSYGLR